MESIKYRSPELIPGEILRRKELTVSAKRVYAQISYSQACNRSVSLSMGWIASRLGLSRQAVSRAAEQLRSHNLLSILGTSSRGTLFSIKRPSSTKKFFLPLYNTNSRYSVSITFVYCLLKFRQGQNDCAWPHLVSIADDLGMSKASVCRILAVLEKDGYIEVQHANGGIKQGNRYRITSKPFFVTVCDSKFESGVSKCNTYNNTSEELKELHNSESSKAAGDIKKQTLLRENGVAYPVAKAISQVHDLKNIENAAINAVCQEQLKSSQGKKFNRAAYLVGILNKSAQTGRKVALNLFAAKEVENFRRLQSSRTSDLPVSRALDNAKKSQILDDLKRRQNELAAGTARRNVPDSIRRMLGVA